MDRVSEYREIIKRVIRDYATFGADEESIETEVIFNDEQGHYELLYAGWDDWRRVHGSVIHIDIRGGKIWIQHDGTRDGVAGELVEAGIPPGQIVLAFHHPSKRKHTEYAVD
jgi:ketopantoate reductase